MEETIEVVPRGSAVAEPTVSNKVPTAATEGAQVGDTRFKLTEGSKLAAEESVPRSLNPYWDISIYTEEEFNAYLDDDELAPELAERYKGLLED